MSPKNRRRLLLVGVLLSSGAALAFIAFGNIGKNLVYYWSPSQMVQAGSNAHGATVRLGGQVKAGSVSFDRETQALTFTVRDETAEVVVHANGAPPEMFREGIGAVVEGSPAADGSFEARRILVKHSNEYRAPVDGKHPDQIYKSVEGL